MQPRRLLTFFATKDTLWWTWCLTWCDLVFIKTGFFCQAASQPVLCAGACRCRTLNFTLVNVMRFTSVHFSSLLRSLWIEVDSTMCCINMFFSVLYFVGLLRMCSYQSSRSLIKMLRVVAPVSTPGVCHYWLAARWISCCWLVHLWDWQFSQLSVHPSVCSSSSYLYQFFHEDIVEEQCWKPY